MFFQYLDKTNSTQNYIKIFYRHDDLKHMLDNNKDSMKLEAMKRIIGVSIFYIRSSV